MDLDELGWNAQWAAKFAAVDIDGVVPARVTAEHGERYVVATAAQLDVDAEIAGRLRHHTRQRAELPAVGDFVAVHPPDGDGPAIIQAVLPRRTEFVRNAAGERTEPQVVAANIDTVFLVSALDHDLNARRIERYLTLAWNSGAEPVIILNKADLSDAAAAQALEIEATAAGVPVHVISARDGDGLDTIQRYLRRGRTIGLLGSSGVGKSTLVNRLLGAEVQRTREVRERDGRGRHSTTHRELFVLPGGGVVIDTPGMRELQMWAGDSGLEATFADIEELAESCRFQDCQHQSEPGCAVRRAVAEGQLDPERLESYEKLGRELRHHERRQSESARFEGKRQDKIANKAMKAYKERG